MGNVATLAVILTLTIVAPLAIILHFVTRWKQSREISGDDEQLLEERLATLEKILDDELPEWRKKYD
jgi:phage shock protein B